MATFTGKLKVHLDAVFGNSIDIGSLKHTIDYKKDFVIASGTGANQANQVWVDSRSISGSSTDSLDLAGSLTDAFGSTTTFTNIKGIMIYSATTNGNNLVVGGGSNAFINWVSNATDEIIITPGGMFMLYNPAADGYAVTASTGDILAIENTSGSSATYEIILFGEV